MRRFGYLLMEVSLLLVLAIFACNVYLHRPVLDSLQKPIMHACCGVAPHHVVRERPLRGIG